MTDETRPSPYLAPKLPLRQLEAILSDLAAVLGKLPPSPGVRDLCARAEQSRAAIVVCRREGFSGPLRRALTAKVLDLEAEALIALRTLRARGSALKSGRGQGTSWARSSSSTPVRRQARAPSRSGRDSS
jgi:hypothetical protein